MDIDVGASDTLKFFMMMVLLRMTNLFRVGEDVRSPSRHMTKL